MIIYPFLVPGDLSYSFVSHSVAKLQITTLFECLLNARWDDGNDLKNKSCGDFWGKVGVVPEITLPVNNIYKI